MRSFDWACTKTIYHASGAFSKSVRASTIVTLIISTILLWNGKALKLTRYVAEAFTNQAETESGAVIYDYDPEYVDRKYELLSLKVIHRRQRTGFEETKDFPIRVNDLVAGRYQVRYWLCYACACHKIQMMSCARNILCCMHMTAVCLGAKTALICSGCTCCLCVT